MANWDFGITRNQSTPIAINFSNTGDNTVVAGVSGQTIRVWRLFFVVSAATNITIKDGSSTSLTGAMNMLANGSAFWDLQGDPWFVTASGNGFVINQSGTAQVSGTCYFSQS